MITSSPSNKTSFEGPPGRGVTANKMTGEMVRRVRPNTRVPNFELKLPCFSPLSLLSSSLLTVRLYLSYRPIITYVSRGNLLEQTHR